MLQERGAPAAVLAHHARSAGQFRWALEHHLQAARSAAQIFALAAAAGHYRQAQELLRQDSLLALTLTPKELRDLYYQLGFIYVYTNAFEEARRLYLQGLELAREAHLPQLEWLVLNHLAYLAVHDGYNLPEAERYAEEALAVARESGDERLLVEAHQEIAGLYTLAFMPEEALRQAEGALRVAERQDDPELLARSLMETELATWQLGRAQEAIRLLERAADLYQESGNKALEARARHSLAFDQAAAGQAKRGAANQTPARKRSTPSGCWL